MLKAAGLEPKHSIAIFHDGRDATAFGATALVYWKLKTVWFEKSFFPKWRAVCVAGSQVYLAHGWGIYEVQNRAFIELYWRLACRGTIHYATVRGFVKHCTIWPWTEAFLQGARKHMLASTTRTLPDAKVLSNCEWFANEKSATVETAHIPQVITEADLDPSVEGITFCSTGR